MFVGFGVGFFRVWLFCLFFFFTLASGKKEPFVYKAPLPPSEPSPPPRPPPRQSSLKGGEDGGDPSVPGPLAGSFPYLHPQLAENHFNK